MDMNHIEVDDVLIQTVADMKLRDSQNRDDVIEQITSQKSLTGKCIMARKWLPAQSTFMETICRQDLEIGPPLNETSGDGSKNGVNYEIKVSLHASKSKVNFVQIRPDHSVDYYIFITYNMYENASIGKGHIFKVPSQKVYELVCQYGGYAHGTNSKLGKVTMENMKGRNCEYALRCNPNSTSGKSRKLWEELVEYEVAYVPSNF